MRIKNHRLNSDQKQESIKSGEWAETCVGHWYQERGHKLLERNYRSPFGEIDLITRDPQGTICFVEVKARHQNALVTPREAWTSAQQKRMLKSALWFISRKEWENKAMRFDLVSVLLKASGECAITVEENVMLDQTI